MVLDLLQNRVATTPNLPLFQRENERISPRPNQPWTRFTFLPVPSIQETIGVTGRNRDLGLAQVDVFYPRDTGTAQPLATAQSILDNVPRGLTLTGTGLTVIIEASYLGPAQSIENYYQLPVVIRWRAHYA